MLVSNLNPVLQNPESETAAAGFGVYIHWPFCVTKCPYCDFNSHVRNSVDNEPWLIALCTELDYMAQYVSTQTVDSIFFGGGTPSLMDPRTTEAIIDRISSLWQVSKDLEITLEANPSSVEADRLRDFRISGVNRVSLGVQSFHDDALKFLGRPHCAAEALKAIEIARETFPRMSFDLIYALPEQTCDDWHADLDRAADFAVDHLSTYQLTIEKNTGFYGMWKRGRLVMSDENIQADLYEITQMVLSAHALPAYEVSNHARAGAECRHNLVYWRGGEWLGIGPGAHGRLNTSNGRLATQQLRKPEQWLNAVTTDRHGTEHSEIILPQAHAEELLMMGLRLSEGVQIDDISAKTQMTIDKIIRENVIADLIDDGLLWRKPGRIGTTISGWLVLNAVTGALLVG